MYETVVMDVDPRGVARVTLNRPGKHNALSGAMIADLSACAARLAHDPAVRVVVLAAAGPTFCAGGDLGWMREQMAADAPVRAQAARALAQMLRAWNDCPKPVIAAVQGNAFGGGVGMCCVADVAVAVQGALFGLTETRLGLIPATIGPYVLARMGEAAARRVFMSARRFEAAEAVTLGVIARAVPAETFEAAIEAEVAPYLSCAPGAVAEAKRLVRSLGPDIDDTVIEATISALVARWDSPEAREGIAAFFDKRPPGWA